MQGWKKRAAAKARRDSKHLSFEQDIVQALQKEVDKQTVDQVIGLHLDGWTMATFPTPVPQARAYWTNLS